MRFFTKISPVLFPFLPPSVSLRSSQVCSLGWGERQRQRSFFFLSRGGSAECLGLWTPEELEEEEEGEVSLVNRDVP